MNRRLRTSIAGASILGLASFSIIPVAQAAAPARVIDRVIVTCSQGSELEVSLERDGRRVEVDMDMYTDPRQRWSVTVRQSGRTVATVNVTANREGEWNRWRYLPSTTGTVNVQARSATGETCSATVRS